ncbi:MAG: type II secretion system F family protein [Candidatus Korobacteraceae bacterium]
MFLIVTAFLLVLVISFVCLLLMTRQSTTERVIDSRLSQINVSDDGYLGEGAPSIFKQTKLSEVGWVDAILQNVPAAHALQKLLTQAASSWSVGQVILGSLVAGLAGYLICSIFLPIRALAVAAALGTAAVPWTFLRGKRERRMKKFNRGLPGALDIIARSLRAGHALSAALEIVGEQAAEPVRCEFRTLCRQQNLGMPFREAVLNMLERVPSPDLQLTVTSMIVQRETGGNLVEILDRTNQVMRDRIRLEGEVRVYTAQGRLTAWILGLLPGFLYIMLRLANPAYMRVMTTDPIGQKLLTACAVQILLGFLVIRRIVKVKL